MTNEEKAAKFIKAAYKEIDTLLEKKTIYQPLKDLENSSSQRKMSKLPNFMTQ